MIEFRAKNKEHRQKENNGWMELIIDSPPERHWFDYHRFRINGKVHAKFSEEFVEDWNRAKMWEKLRD